MTMPNAAVAALSDEPAREAIRRELDTTMLVEAGAGSGKTTLMVDRLVAYIVRGTPVDEIAAVTFTKKAANELRERLESRLDAESRNASHSDIEHTRIHNALHDRERLFIGTVHAFCSRVLREHALDAGLPPDFTELDEVESKGLRAAAWNEFLERSAREDNDLWAPVASLGIEPFSLASAFAQRDQYRDIDFPAEDVVAPSHGAVRDALLELMECAQALRASKTDDNRDELQQSIDRLWRGYQTHNQWASGPDFARDSTMFLTASKRKLVQVRWGASKPEKEAAKAFAESIESFVQQQLQPWFDQWWAHAYPAIITLLTAASDNALAQRRRTGQLGFDDLLTETARLLRDNPTTRRALGARWRHLLVDEFQDTDPVQAEVCFLLASDPADGNDWRTVTLRSGSLFVVGDPKQSIYRFRRADLSTYRLVETRIALSGRVERLTRNFRSVSPIGTLVNEHFRNVFPVNEESPESHYQASFAPFVAASVRETTVHSGVWYYHAGPAERATNDELIADDASRLASWIAHRCNVVQDRVPQDFLILTSRKQELARYAHELALRNLPVSASGATSEAHKVIAELLVVLRALADPSNPVAVIAALEGVCAGCSHEDLWSAREAGVEFRITHPPTEHISPVGRPLRQFHAWWVASQQLPVASLLERMMDESGLLLLAASSDLGDRTAGQLLQLVSVLQSNDTSGADLHSAIALIDDALELDESDPSLRVGRTDAVRLMNLHKAKGLEAPVVILAAPVPRSPRAPAIATWRDANGKPSGALEVCDDRGTVVARPLNWVLRSAEESARQAAEQNRLLYVAATRAQDELVVARRMPYVSAKSQRGDESAWSPLAPVLDMHAQPLTLVTTIPPGRRALQLSAAELAKRTARADAQRASAGASRYELVNVTEAAKRTASQAADDGAPMVAELMESGMEPLTVGGRDFGSLVHLAIEGALRGRSEQQLDEYVNALVWHQHSSLGDREREQLARSVLDAVAQAKVSQAWAMLEAEGNTTLAELSVATLVVTDGGAVLSEGVIDAVGKTASGWLVVDWKNSAGSDSQWNALLPAYDEQIGAYLATLRQRTGIEGTAQVVRIRRAI
jgi:ATP-dependent helicase/nuclease subunit A